MRPTFVELLDHTEGDQWEGAEFGPVLFGDDQPPPAALKSCRIQFRHGIRAELGHTLSSEVEDGAGTIIIDDAATWKITVPEQLLPLTAGGWPSKKWDWSLRVVDVNDAPLTIYAGPIEIFRNPTQPQPPAVPNE